MCETVVMPPLTHACIIYLQVVSNELAVLSQQHDGQADELRRVSVKLSAAEQLVRAKDAEVEDLRRAYEGLALENRR